MKKIPSFSRHLGKDLLSLFDSLVPHFKSAIPWTKRSIYFLWDLSGFRFVSTKIITPVDPSTGKKRPITLTLWIVGIYAALFGIASQRYENRTDVIENRVNTLFAQLATPTYKKAISRIPLIQSMQCPKKPDILSPKTVFDSLFAVYDSDFIPDIPDYDRADISKPRARIPFQKSSNALWGLRKAIFGIEQPNPEIVQLLKGIIEDWKENLDGVELERCLLNGVNLENANFSGSVLSGSEIKNSYLKNAIFKNADLRGTYFNNSFLDMADFQSAELNAAQFDKSELANSNFQNAKCERTNFKGANLQNANFNNAFLKGAIFDNANLVGVKEFGLSQISAAYSFHNATMDSDMRKEIETNYGFLLFPPEKRIHLSGYNFQGKYLVRSIFQRVDLSGSNFILANLTQADFDSSNLHNSNLSHASLINANLGSAVLTNSKLIGADLTWAQCWYTNFQKADFQDANLTKANIRKADLRGVKNLSIEQICQTETCYESLIDDVLTTKIENSCPKILEQPTYK